MRIAPGRSDISAFAIGRPGLDICDPRSIERALGDIEPDVLINLAGYTDVDGAENEPDLAFALNATGARLLAEAAARRGVPIVHVSTAYVFDGLKASPYVETDASHPATAYGSSRAAGESGVAEANPRHVILRTGWVLSPFGRCFVSNILQRIQLGLPLKVAQGQLGNPTYAPHLVDAILAVARQITDKPQEETRWGIYHAAGSGVASWYDVAREVLQASERLAGLSASLEAVPPSEFPARAGRLANSALDCSKLERVFGVKLPDWQDGIQECAARLLEAGASPPATGLA
jgi:dTDP-4-dehydrorhamnose reductase